MVVLTYLARYTHKIAIDDHRLIDSDHQHVRFRYKDYRDHDKRKVMQLKSDEFIRRFLQHVLPDGFMRIRHYGFLANRCRRQRLEEISPFLAAQGGDVATRRTRPGKAIEKNRATTTPFTCPCPKCKQGWLIVIITLPPPRRSEVAMRH